MDTISPDADPTPDLDTAAERRARLAWEAERIAEADASLAAGYYATSEEVDTWLDSLGTKTPLPVPYPRHPRPL